MKHLPIRYFTLLVSLMIGVGLSGFAQTGKTKPQGQSAVKPYLVDVRTPAEFAEGSARGAVNIPLDKIPANVENLKKKKNIVVFCRSGNRSAVAKSILEQNGVLNVRDGGSVQQVIHQYN
jgi:rhodanese-related sulfurtransferase